MQAQFLNFGILQVIIDFDGIYARFIKITDKLVLGHFAPL